MKKQPEPPASDDPPEFEPALKELEQIVEKLEQGDLPLKDSLSVFERGVALSRHCHQMLEQARQTVTVLTDPEDVGSEQAFSSVDPAAGAPDD
ncbi:MAG: exodeoxyribonuclease VII small subunit [Wenzhouxiangella sp.]